MEFPRTEVRSCHLHINHNKLLNLAQLQSVFQILFSSSPSVTLLVVCTIFGCYLIKQLIDTVSHVLEGISKTLTSWKFQFSKTCRKKSISGWLYSCTTPQISNHANVRHNLKFDDVLCIGWNYLILDPFSSTLFGMVYASCTVVANRLISSDGLFKYFQQHQNVSVRTSSSIGCGSRLVTTFLLSLFRCLYWFSGFFVIEVYNCFPVFFLYLIEFLFDI